MNLAILPDRATIKPRLDPAITARSSLEALRDGRFTAIGETHDIGTPVRWLHNPSDDIEWHIVLHKFYHAPGLVQLWHETGDDCWIDLLKAHLQCWIETVAPGYIAADVTGRRIRNWVYALALYGDGDRHFVTRVELSLREQISWLIDNLHPGRNHRTLELFAVLIGAVWLGESRWSQFALDALADNAEADFLPDGAHVELSSHYHCLALRNLIEAIEVAENNRLAVPQRLRSAVERASRFARVMHKPDGTIPMLSDADTGDYRTMLPAGPPPGLIESYPDAGYVFLRDRAAVAGFARGSYLVLDCGDIGAGNHGHLDCLSIEFASQGRSLVVDPGRYNYHEASEPNWRAKFRRTRAHSLVQVNGLDQTCYAQGPKRMKVRGPAPRATLNKAVDAGTFRLVQAQAESAEYPVEIERSIIAHDDGWWLVFDRVTARNAHRYELLFQLDPEAQDRAHILELPDGTRAVQSPNLLMVPLSSHVDTWTFEQGWIAPRYGERLKAPRFVSAMTAANGWYATLLMPFADTMPDISFAVAGSVAIINDLRFDLERGKPC
jgi:hypothetical protein